ncbi:MAG: HPr family phosphocarrier protein [Eubacteriales bacterium]|nr:HPr family phosphocarrier protein [Eubacteriales bacterium]
MKEFNFTISDPLGIHARPAGLLAKLIKGYDGTTVTFEKDGKEAKATQLMKLMSLAIKQGDTIKVKVDGGAEGDVASAIEAFLKENL